MCVPSTQIYWKNIKTLIGLKEKKEKKRQYLIGSNKISTVSIGSNEEKKNYVQIKNITWIKYYR